MGYALHIPVSTFEALPSVGTPVKVLAHLVIREDAHSLYGFFTEEERDFFRLLLGVSGIGPKMAMVVMSGIPLNELKQAIVEGALPVLTAISGIGKKTAERMIVELKEKIVVEERRTAGSIFSKSATEARVHEDSLRALVELGYRRQNAKEAVERAIGENPDKKYSVEELIRVSLKFV